jgi:GT2 family glycosyltransferase
MAARSTSAHRIPIFRRAAERYVEIPLGGRRQEVDWLIGAAMIIRREAFDAVRGWDSRFFLYLEDVDFCLRLRRAGWSTVYAPDIALRHAHQRASDASKGGLLASPARRHHVRSTLRFFLRNPGLITFGLRRTTGSPEGT